jgi:methylated-DNA-[protein]-cysteine S-methyltransferase
MIARSREPPMKNGQHFWGRIETPFGNFAAWVDERGRLVRFFLRTGGAAKVDPRAERDDDAVEDVRKQVAQYCTGVRRAFDLECAADGSDFQHLVWDQLAKIPFGETTSYGAIARTIGLPDSARAVGVANASNPIALIVPCHRVIGSNGALVGYGGGLPLKRALLAHEAKVAGHKRDLFD